MPSVFMINMKFYRRPFTVVVAPYYTSYHIKLTIDQNVITVDHGTSNAPAVIYLPF